MIMKNNELKVVDIGHSNLSLENAQAVFETTVSKTLYKGNTRVLKVITGHGSGELRKTIRQWCLEQEGRFKAVIYGEDYNIFNRIAVDMRADCKINKDMDFGRSNSAITYIWLW